MVVSLRKKRWHRRIIRLFGLRRQKAIARPISKAAPVPAWIARIPPSAPF